MKYLSFIAACAMCAFSVGAADLSDLIIKTPAQETVNPDDVMLRRPAGRSPSDLEARAKAAAAAAEALEREKEAKAKAEAEAKAKEEAEAKAKEEAEAKVKAEAEAKAKEEAAKAAAEAEAKAKEEAEAKAKEDEAKAAAEAEIKSLREQIAREKAAREEIAGKAALDRAAAEKAAAQAVEDRKAAEKAAAQAAADRAAAEKATEAKAKAEKRIEYLQNPDPDERPKPKKLEAPAEQRDVTETVGKKKKAKKEKGASARTGRDAVITSERTDYDRKEGIILFDRNVFVDDELYQMHADRLFVFLDGTNDLKRIVAIGNVSITNEQRTASCSRAVFTKAASKIVMYGDEASNAKLSDPSQRGGVAEGKKITFWLDAEQVEVEGSAVRLPGGMLKGKDPKKFLDQAK